MIGCSSDMELRLSYNSGIIDGIMMVANVLNGCNNDKECKREMVAAIHEIAQRIAVRRGRHLTYLFVDDLS